MLPGLGGAGVALGWVGLGWVASAVFSTSVDFASVSASAAFDLSVVAPFPFPAKSPPSAEPSPPRIDLFPPGVCVVFGVAAVFAGSVAAAEAWAIWSRVARATSAVSSRSPREY